MILYLISVSILTAILILTSMIFRKKASARVIYALWILLVIRICTPVAGIVVTLPYTDRNVENVSSETAEQVSEPEHQSVQTESDAPIIDLTLIWHSGTIIITAWFALSNILFLRKLRLYRTEHSEYRHKNVYITSCISSPCIAGIFPDIYITPDAARSPDVELILRHEYTHILHLDHIWSFVRTLTLCIFWWNPLIWIAVFLSKQDSELACDESVVKNMDNNQKSAYGLILIDVSQGNITGSVGLGDGHLKERIIMLGKKKNIASAIVAILLSVTTLCSVLFTPVFAGEGIYDSFSQLIYEENVVKLINNNTYADSGIILYSLCLENGDNRSYFNIAAPADYEERQFPVTISSFAGHDMSACADLCGGDSIAVVYVPEVNEPDAGWSIEGHSYSDLMLIIDLLVKCKFVDKSNIIVTVT